MRAFPIPEEPPVFLSLGCLGRRAFSLVEVALALGILGFALIPLMGLVSVGLNTSRDNAQRQAGSQIVEWAQGRAKAAHQAGTLAVLPGGPYPFDAMGLLLTGTNAPVYLATLRCASLPLPGSTQSLWSVEVITRRPDNPNPLSRNVLWFGK